MKFYSVLEKKLFRKLNTPKKIQDFLGTLKINFEEDGELLQSPRRVLKSGKAYCIEGAMLAAAILEFHGYPPLLMDLRAIQKEDDHVVAVFKQFGCWGAISKTNHGVLRYREPVYKTLRELALSYFHEYFTDSGNKTMREYSVPMDLRRFDKINWRTTEEDLWDVAEAVDLARHYWMLGKKQIRNLRKADPIEIELGKITEYKDPVKR
jgi:hypothetical protein